MSLRPSFMGIESMKQTLFSAQKSLDITGNNISNVNTVGYSRQRADQVSVSVLSESLYFDTSTSLAGQGTATSGVTLHIHELLDNTNGMTSGDMLNYQLDVFRKTMDEYRGKKNQRLVFIHGKGEGVLRNALLKELKSKYGSWNIVP